MARQTQRILFGLFRGLAIVIASLTLAALASGVRAEALDIERMPADGLVLALVAVTVIAAMAIGYRYASGLSSRDIDGDDSATLDALVRAASDSGRDSGEFRAIIATETFESRLRDQWKDSLAQSSELALVALQIENDQDTTTLADASAASLAKSLANLVAMHGGLLNQVSRHRFRALFANVTLDQLDQIAEDLRLAVEDLGSDRQLAVDERITACIGVAVGQPGERATTDRFEAAALSALEQARRRGGNRIQFHALH